MNNNYSSKVAKKKQKYESKRNEIRNKRTQQAITLKQQHRTKHNTRLNAVKPESKMNK